MLRRLKLTSIKLLGQRLAHSKHYMTISVYYELAIISQISAM